MSINHIIDENIQPKFDLYAKSINLDPTDGIIDPLKFKATNNDVINLSSLSSYGAASERLTSNGDGTVSWVAGTGTSGIEYSGSIPVTSGQIAIYSAPDGSLVDKTTYTESELFLKDGSRQMTGSLNMAGNSIDNNVILNTTVIQPNPVLDPFNINLQSDNLNFNVINLNVNGQLGQEVTWRVTRQGVNYGEFGTEPGVFYFGNFNNPAVNTEIRGANNEKLVIDDSTPVPECRLENLNLDLTSKDIINVNSIDTQTTSTAVLNGGLNPDITVNSNLDLGGTKQIKNCQLLAVDNIQSQTGPGDITIASNIDFQQRDFKNCNLIAVDNIQSINLTDDVVIGSNIDMFQKEIKNCSNITVTDINTDTITANLPATEVSLGTNTDLNLNGNNIIGLDTINGIQPSGGVYSNPTQNSYSGATTETDILTGTEYGTKTIPANDGFSAGSLYSLKIGGEFDATNNDVFTIRVLSNYNTVNEAEFVNIPITITDSNLTNQYFELEIDFAIRTVGGAAVASIVTNGSFDYYNTNNLKKGTGINNINNTTFRTDIDNTLSVTYATTEASVNFTCDIATITKFY